jgi:hypothetical protein
MEGGVIFIPILGILAPMFLVGWIVWIGGKSQARRLDALTSAQARIMEKFGSAREFIEFLQTPGGMRYLDAFTMPKKAPSERILKSVTAGIVLTSLGLGLLAIGGFYRFEEAPPVIIGTLVLSLGVGFLVSAWLSTRLSRAWGLMGEGNGAPAEG